MRLAILAAALALGAGCRAPERGRVLLIGIDGASPRVTGPLAQQGRLPQLARLAREGAHGPLHAPLPLWSPRIWNSIATGKNPSKHGILGFVKEEGGAKQDLYLSTDRRVHALWNIASDAGLRVGVVNWWNTYPPERIAGVMISDHVLPGQSLERRLAYQATGHDRAPRVFPESWGERVQAILEAPLPEGEGPVRAGEVLPPWVKAEKIGAAWRADAQVVALALAVEAELHPDLLMVFLSGIDRASHWLWGNLEPPERYPPPLRPSDEARRGGREALLRIYEHTDALIGSLLERYGARDLVLVTSDHGFEAGVVYEILTGAHQTEQAAHGVLFARGPGIAPGSSTQGAAGAVSVNDVTPSVLAWLGLPLGADMDGRPFFFLATEPPAQIASHDVGTIEHIGDAASGAEGEVKDQLRELGYIE